MWIKISIHRIHEIRWIRRIRRICVLKIAITLK